MDKPEIFIYKTISPHFPSQLQLITHLTLAALQQQVLLRKVKVFTFTE